MDRDALMRLSRIALPIVAVLSFAVGVGFTIAVAGNTLAYDFQAYVGAAQRILDGQPLYDSTVNVAGPYAIYLYPPPFAVAFLPLAVLPDGAALWIWIGISIACVVTAIALMPVRIEVRWMILLVAGLDWPVVYAIKLGQVGPVLLLVYAVGWRCLTSSRAVGMAAAVGTLIKLQPALIFLWAVVIRRPRIVVAGLGLIAVASLTSSLVLGLDVWSDWFGLLGRVNAPVTTPHNMTIGAVVLGFGVPESIASAVQWASAAATLAVWAFVSARRSPESGYLATVVASQLLSPLFWDHYAILLLLPVAYLLARHQWWVLVVPLATSIVFLSMTPALVYPAAFFVCLAALAFHRERSAAVVVPLPLRADVSG